MTRNERIELYITGALWDEDLGTYGGWLRERGLAEATVHDRMRFAAHCERVLGGDVDPREATTEHIDLLRLRMSHVADRTRRGYIRAWMDFVRAVNEGTDQHRGLPYWRSEDFDRDLQHYSEWLSSSGVPSNRIRDNVKFVRHCVRRLWEDVDDLTPEMIGVDEFERLSDLMCGEITDNCRVRYLRALGSFISFKTGTNPYRELTVPDRNADNMAYIYSIARGHELEPELQLYIGTLEHRDYRKYTITDKVRSVLSCYNRLTASGWAGTLRDITSETLQYLRSLMDNLKESTAQVYLRNFGLFLEFITGTNPYHEARIMWNNPMDVVNRRFIFSNDWLKLVSHAEPDEYVILVLGAMLGLRRSEIAWLRLEDIGRDRITIRGKGHGPDGKMVVMDLPQEVREAIDDYMPLRERIIATHGDHSDGHLLVRRHYYPGESMAPDTVGDMVSALGKRAGVVVTTHCLRRLYATSLYDLGTDIDTLRRMMRHENVSTTMRCYLAADPRKVQEANRGLADVLFKGKRPNSPSSTIPTDIRSVPM